MYLLLIILMLIVSVLMCFIVMIQNSKGGGLASSFASSNQIMGVRKTTDFLEKTTWTLAAAMVVFSVISAYTIKGEGAAKSSYEQKAVESEMQNPLNLPQGTNAPAAEAPVAAPAASDSAAN